MSGKSEELKGRAKEAAGAITDDDRLRRRKGGSGRRQSQASGR